MSKALKLLALCVFLMVFTLQSAQAAEAIMGISVKVVQCGPRANLKKACEENAKCCGFMSMTEFTQSEDDQDYSVSKETPIRLSQNTVLE